MYLCLREACESALKEKHFLEVSEMEGFVDDATTSHLKQLEALESVFKKAAEDDTPSEVCTSLCFLDYRFNK
jgi:STIP1 family protein 1